MHSPPRWNYPSATFSPLLEFCGLISSCRLSPSWLRRRNVWHSTLVPPSGSVWQNGGPEVFLCHAEVSKGRKGRAAETVARTSACGWSSEGTAEPVRAKMGSSHWERTMAEEQEAGQKSERRDVNLKEIEWYPKNYMEKKTQVTLNHWECLTTVGITEEDASSYINSKWLSSHIICPSAFWWGDFLFHCTGTSILEMQSSAEEWRRVF